TIVPALGAGISASTLSVEISKIGSSRFTSSPTFLSQRERVPSAMDSPIWGIITSTRAIIAQPQVSSYGQFLRSVGSDLGGGAGCRIAETTSHGSVRAPRAPPTNI